LLLLAAVAVLLALRNLGAWLVVEDPLEQASAIAVLSGRMPDRALEAARIYKRGYAGKVWLTRSEEPGATLQKLGIPYRGEDFYDREILLEEGVPAERIEILEPPIRNTADEMTTIAAALRPESRPIVILVTSQLHTRRARTLWRHLSGSSGRAILAAAPEQGSDPRHWWRTTGDALEVVREILGLLNAWAGLPLRPSP